MDKYYKRFERSQSLNGNLIVQIARNAAGMVVFREDSEKKLKIAIDNFWIEQQKIEQLAAKNSAAKTTPTRLTKTADGKFISKSQLEKSDSPRKKTFWN